MEKNVTLRLEEAILQAARHIAVEERTSLSGWVADLISRETRRRRSFDAVRAEALAELEGGHSLGGAGHVPGGADHVPGGGEAAR